MLSVFLIFDFGCADEVCNGSIESVVLLSKSELMFGGERIYVGVKNRCEIGVRKILKYANIIAGTIDNVVIVRDFRSKFKCRNKICFDEFHRIAPTDGTKMNS